MGSKTISFFEWRMEKTYNARSRIGTGPGVSGAFEYGAKSRLRKKKENSYTRSDCWKAYEIGFSEMEKTLKSGIKIECCSCGHIISE